MTTATHNDGTLPTCNSQKHLETQDATTLPHHDDTMTRRTMPTRTHAATINTTRRRS
ncbi:hypothetical protein SCLCIDRAFT_1222284 [Scleroderma citrinum Foug A]|uniref:Uncharacterized protein n=1 Tax=Scleroderma citrinum Foug A TaxID=1036808 RepID=A0A0C2ZN69_9AGAM|nr:hypothetical protein SCLCIDRAFT_1222284 [Scleroderma citrinum Foug A]